VKKRRRKLFRICIFIIAVLVIYKVRNMGDESEDAQVFRTITESDLTDFTESENTGKKNETENKIRVLIMGNGYHGEVHPKAVLSSKGEMYLESESGKQCIAAGEEVVIVPDDDRLKEGILRVSSEENITLCHLERGYGTPSYEGVMELRTTPEGIVIVNELPVEAYLKAVVPSEMPSSYELEALKAQAVCARSYAYRQMEDYGYPEYKAHVNDSTDYQVYGNSKTQKSTNRAVEETKGQVVYYMGKIATTYYYSTSCGRTTDMSAWGTKREEKNAYLKSVKVKGSKGDYEKDLPWYRWSITVPADTMTDIIELNTGKETGLLRKIEVTKRGGGDVVTEITATGETGTVSVKTENKIRKALGGDEYTITLQDGTKTQGRELLPSAFFDIRKEGDSFVIEGGGFGHGIGMSQNGAHEMAKQGRNYIDILEMFYHNIEVR